MAKSRVAPLKKRTLPQLELMATVVGARLASYLQSILNVSKSFFWSDSQIVLYWLSTSKPLKRFVHNRVKEVKELTSNSSWNYCPTTDNPADLLTRGMKTVQLTSSTLWAQGPSWLPDTAGWPTWNPTSTVLLCTIAEEAEATLSATSNTATNTDDVMEPKELNLAKVVYLFTYISLQRLIRITALPHPLIDEDEWSDPTFNEDPNLVQHLAKHRANLIHHFWNRWRKEYLTSL